MIRFLIDDQGRTKKKLKPLDISPTLRREMHGNEPRVVEPEGWVDYEKGDDVMTGGQGEYLRQWRQKRKQEKGGWITKAYGNMKSRNLRKFSEDLPFSKLEFVDWLDGNYSETFHSLFTDYVESGCEIRLAPSVDRIDDYKPYSLDNIRLTTWEENNARGRESRKNKEQCGKMAKEVWSKRVAQLSLEGELLNIFPSTREAERQLGFVDSSTIAKVCRGVKKTHKGFKWEYVEEETLVNKFTFVELFAGIGGVSFGFEKVGGKCLLAAEYDPQREGKRQFAQEAFKVLHPDTPVTGDVTKLDAKDVPDHDVLSFTFPCQSFSVAGKRGGFDDIRGTLYFEAMRIASEKKPKIIFAENVKGIIGHDGGKTLDTLVKVANECGYRVDFNVLNSKYFGVAQNRERWFLVGIREDLVANEPWHINPKDKTVVPKGKRRISGYDDVKTFNFDWPEQGEVTTRLRDILESGVDEKYYLSEEKTAKLVAQLEEGEQVPRWIPKPDEVNRTLRSGGKASLSDKHNYDHIAVESQSLDAGMKEGATKVRTDELASTLTASYHKGLCGQSRPFVGEEVPPVLTPDRLEKRQNGRRFKEDDKESFTLTAQDKHGVAIGENPRYRIRKLTPLETFRLQGFPDSAHQALVDAGISDSQRYKMAGNAVTVNVIEALGERLLPYLTK